MSDKLDIKTAADGKRLVGELQDRSVDYGRPAFVTTNPRGEPRDMLKQFHFNYPFFPVIPVPRSAIVMACAPDSVVEFTIPDGTIWVTLSAARNNTVNTIWSFDGIPPVFADLLAAAGTPFSGVLNPPNDVAYLIYPGKQIMARTDTAGFVCITPYISTDAAGFKK